MLTRIEVEYMTIVPRELKKLNENLEKLIELFQLHNSALKT